MYPAVGETPLPRKTEQEEQVYRAFSAFAVIAVTASAGGLNALSEFLSELPANFSCPIVIVQHLGSARQYRSVLAQILGRHTLLTVKWAEEGDSLRPGLVLLAPQDSHLAISADQTVHLVAASEEMIGCRPSADLLFSSIAQQFRSRAIGVVLSGALYDGAYGTYQIASAGGRVLVQASESAFLPDMPNAAILTGGVDFAFSPAMIARALITLVMVPGAAAWFQVWRSKNLNLPSHLTNKVFRESMV